MGFFYTGNDFDFNRYRLCYRFFEYNTGTYPGYSISLFGSIIGLVYGFVDGFVGFFILVWLYNWFEAKK